MTTLVIAVFAFGLILWTVLRTGLRRSRTMMHQFSRSLNGLYINGGPFGDTFVRLRRGATDIQIDFSPVSNWQPDFRCRMLASWKNRSPFTRTTPDACQSVGGVEPRPLSTADAEINRYLGMHATVVEAQRGCFELTSVIRAESAGDALGWYRAAVKFYERLHAETEPGIRFSSSSIAADFNSVCCSVCGTPLAGSPMIYCDRCGAPHHAECWQYNDGCGIYGCR